MEVRLFGFFFPITVPIDVNALSLHRINHFLSGVSSRTLASFVLMFNRDYLDRACQ